MCNHISDIKKLHKQLVYAKKEQEIDCNFFSQVVTPWSSDEKNIALRHIDLEKKQLEEVTYTDLVGRSTKIAAFLRQQQFTKGDSLMLMLGQHPLWYYMLLASIHEGIGIVPCSRLLTSEDLKYRINCLGAKGIVAAQSLEKTIDNVLSDCASLGATITTGEGSSSWLSIDNILKDTQLATVRPVDTTNKDSWIYLYTSGTTGLPKPVVHNQDYPFFHIPTGSEWMQASKDDLVYNASDTGWGFSVWTTMAAWSMGATLLVASTNKKFDAHNTLSLLEDQKVTIFCAAPTVLRRLVAHPSFDHFPLAALKRIVTVGEALDETVISKFQAKKIDIHVGFGQAETPLLLARWAGQAHIPSTMGKEGLYKIALLDENYQPVKVGEVGQIAVDLSDGKNGIMKGYIGSPDATRDAFSPDGRYYITGDWAKNDGSGNLKYEGRKDDLLKSRGYRIGPDEIEKVGMSHPSVEKIAVVQVPITKGSQNHNIKAFVLLKDSYSATPELAESIRLHIKKETAAYRRPDFVQFLTRQQWSQYETISGKIRRSALRQLAIRELEEDEQVAEVSCPQPK